MAKFDVEIVETTILKCNTSIEAESKEQAEELAREFYENGDFQPDDWEVDMDNGGVEFNIEFKDIADIVNDMCSGCRHNSETTCSGLQDRQNPPRCWEE